MNPRPTKAKPIRKILRDATLSLSCAILIALVASRVNNSPSIILPAHHAVLDQNITDIDLDTLTFQRAIDSLSSKTNAKFVIDPSLAPALFADDLWSKRPEFRDSLLQHFHNVPLRVLLARVLDQWGDHLPVDCRIEGNTITFHAPTTTPAIERRIYDLRQFTIPFNRWSSEVESWRPPRTMAGVLFGGPNTGTSRVDYEDPDDESAADLIQFFRTTLIERRFEEVQLLAIWSGCAIVEAPQDLQNRLAQFIAMLAQNERASKGVLQ